MWPWTLTYQKFLLCRSRRILTPKIKHVHLLVLIWERLQTLTTTTTTPTTPYATVQPLRRHIANKSVIKPIRGATHPWTCRIYNSLISILMWNVCCCRHCSQIRWFNNYNFWFIRHHSGSLFPETGHNFNGSGPNLASNNPRMVVSGWGL